MISRHFSVTPHGYQSRGIKYASAHHYCIIGDEMGLGKTLQGLGTIFETKSKKTLVVTPAGIRTNWYLEVDFCVQYFVNMKIVHTEKELHELQNPDQYEIIVISYNMIVAAERLFDWADMVIADEAHRLKDMQTQWTLAFHKYVYEYAPERLLLLTGTPLENRVSEWYSLLVLMGYSPRNTNGERIQDHFKDPVSFARFFSEVRYVSVPGNGVRERYFGIRNRPALRQLLKSKYLRRLSQDELELPRLVGKTVAVDYSDDRELREAWSEHVAGRTKTNSRAKAKSALVKASFSARYSRGVHEETGRPLIIFSDHIEAAEKIHAALEKEGAEIILGKTPMKKRDEICARFQKGQVPYLVASIGALREGKTLTAATDGVFNDLPWSPSRMKQAIMRYYRQGQRHLCRYHKIIGSPQDRYISDMLDEKMDTIEQGT